jgi:hypothetical protein
VVVGVGSDVVVVGVGSDVVVVGVGSDVVVVGVGLDVVVSTALVAVVVVESAALAVVVVAESRVPVAVVSTLVPATVPMSADALGANPKTPTIARPTMTSRNQEDCRCALFATLFGGVLNRETGRSLGPTRPCTR